MPSIEETETIFPHQKSSLPGRHENYSHRGAGSLINTDVPSNTTSKIKEKEISSPHHKKVASRIVMKTLHTVERSCSLIRMHRQTQHPRSKKKKKSSPHQKK
jgi:hypothetical protein